MPVTPWVYLSSAGPGSGQRAATSASSSTSRYGSPTAARSGPMPMSIRRTGPQRRRASTCTGFSAPNVTVAAASTAGPATVPVSGSTPLGRSTARTGTPAPSAASTSAAAAGRSGPRPEMPTIPSTARSARRAASAARSGCRATSITRPAARRSAANPSGWRAVAIQQQRGDGHPAPAQLEAGPQRVPAVVPGADQQRDPPAGHPAAALGEQLTSPYRHAECGTTHEHARRRAGERPLLGGAHLRRGPDPPHPGTLAGRADRLRRWASR